MRKIQEHDLSSLCFAESARFLEDPENSIQPKKLCQLVVSAIATP